MKPALQSLGQVFHCVKWGLEGTAMLEACPCRHGAHFQQKETDSK